MSSNSHNFWPCTPYHPVYYQPLPNYYISRNIADPQWYDYIEDPYLTDLYATEMNYFMGYYYYYYYQTTSGYIDDQFPFMVSSFDYIDDSYLWYDDFNQTTGELIDGVYVTNERGFIDHHQAQVNNFYVSRNINGDHYFAPHNLDHNHHTYNGQSSFVRIDDPNLWGDVYNQPTGEFTNGVDVEGIEYENEKEVIEEFIGYMLKTRIHCATDDDGGEICVICQCRYENDETIGVLKCQHEYHASCINEWLLKGKRSCPICRSSVLPS